MVEFKIDEKELQKLARKEPVETFISFALNRIGKEQYKKWEKEDGKSVAILKLRTIAWYYKLRAAGYDHELAKDLSKDMTIHELSVCLITHMNEEKKGE